jgi:acyl-CoA synthetase (AMP-forming)/AMP-acid ligase II
VTCDRALPEGDPATLPPPPGDPSAIRWVFYTSGTTADPKGALHSDATILAGSRAVADRYELGPDDRYPMVFPFTHIGGVGMLVVQLLSGCATLAVEQYDPERTPQFMAASGVTVPAGGTPLALLYLQYQRAHSGTRAFPRARAVMTGAAPKPPGLHTDIRREIGGVGAVSVYGLTETPFLVVASVRDPDDKLATTEGRPVPGVELRVVREDGRACNPDETGEIRARGVVVCAGYLNPERDADAFDADGFFRTGDLGRVDADGYVTVSGRLKDVIIRKGENISAKEVEDVIYDHPSVAEVAVIGLPDAVLGERCCAVLLATAGREAPTLEEIAAWCGDAGLARQKWPEQVEVLTDFPRNASGKVLKYRLRELYGERV